MTEKPPTRRRWFQFSLRTFLIVIMLVGFGGAWVGMQLQQKRRHERVVNEIVKLGGSVFVSNEGDVPVWKEWLFGSYAVQSIIWNLENTNTTDSLLAQTQGMNLASLILRSTKVTDAELAHLNGLTSLKYLFLDNTQISDAGLAHLEALTSLEWLDLRNTQVTDAGLIHLRGLTSLRWLHLSDTRITDAGLKHLKGMTSLSRLYLDNTQVTQAGVDRLKQAIPSCIITYTP